MNLNKRGFTLVELLVVVAMIAIILGAISTSVTAAQQRARIQKATSDVKVITQAILAYENYNKNYELQPMGAIGAGGVDADANSLAFLLGNSEAAKSGGQIPALLMASLRSGGKLMDPWGTPYKLHIQAGVVSTPSASASLQTRYFLPNFYRLSNKERGLE